jgi:glycosyltransferase involved in cell wall biosynthesis
VATDVGNMRNFIKQGETGYVVSDNNPGELADKIGIILSDSNNIASVLAIRESISRYDWSNIAAAITEEFYKVSSQKKTLVA